MKKIIIFFLLTTMYCFADSPVPDYEIRLDIQETTDPFSIKNLYAGNTPLVRSYFTTQGSGYSVTNWGATLSYGTNGEDSVTWVQIPGVNVTNYFDFQFAIGDIPTNGRFFAEVIMTNATRVITWGQGELIVKKSRSGSQGDLDLGASINYGNVSDYSNVGSDGPYREGTNIYFSSNSDGSKNINVAGAGTTEVIIGGDGIDNTVSGTTNTLSVDASVARTGDVNFLQAQVTTNATNISGLSVTQGLQQVAIDNILSTQAVNTAGIATNLSNISALTATQGLQQVSIDNILITQSLQQVAIDANSATGAWNAAAISSNANDISILETNVFKYNQNNSAGAGTTNTFDDLTSSNATIANALFVGGNLNVASNFTSGNSSTALGLYSVVAGGMSNAAYGSGDFVAGGQFNIATGGLSHAQGNSTLASGSASHSEGVNTEASGLAAHAEGAGTTASGLAAHAEGSATEASANAAHAEGSNTEASGLAAHAEGAETTASGDYAHAAGKDANAIHDYTYVWSDDTAITSTVPKQYTVNAEGGIRLMGGDVNVPNNLTVTGLIDAQGGLTNTSGPVQMHVDLDLNGNYLTDTDGTVDVDTELNVSAASNAIFKLTSTQTAVVAGEVFGSVEWVTSDLSNPGTNASIACVATGPAANGNIILSTSDSGVLTEQARLTSAGYLGVGTDTPDRALDVEDSLVRMADFKSTSATRAYIAISEADTTEGQVGFGAEGNDAIIRAGGDQHVYVTSTGNLLLGTTDNDYKLTVNQGAGDDNIAGFQSSDVSQPATDFATADSYMVFDKVTGNGGGGRIIGLSDSDVTALDFRGILGVTSPTVPAVSINVGKTDGGTSWQALDDDEVALVLENITTDLMTIYGNGDAQIDGNLTANSIYTNEVYVDKAGNDSTGTGAFNNKFLTIKHALTNITDSSIANPYTVIVGSGLFVVDNSDGPIQYGSDINIISAGGSDRTSIIPADNDNNLFEPQGATSLSGFRIIGPTNATAINYTVANIFQVHRITAINCKNGVVISNALAATEIDKFFLSTDGPTIDNGIKLLAGGIALTDSGLGTLSTGPINNFVNISGSNSIADISDMVIANTNTAKGIAVSDLAEVTMAGGRIDGLEGSSALESGISVDNARCADFKGVSIRHTDKGVTATNGNFSLSAVSIENAGLGLELSGSVTANVHGVTCQNNPSDLVVLGTNVVLSGSGNTMTASKVTIPPDMVTPPVFSYQSKDPGDEATVFVSEIHVGSIEHPKETALGSGDTYVNGMKVIVFNSATTNYTDVSTNAASLTAGTFTFASTNAGDIIFVGSTRLIPGGGTHKFLGMKMIIDTPQVGGVISHEYWDGSNWTNFNVMTTQDLSPNLPFNGEMFEKEAGIYQINFNTEMDSDWTTNDPPSLGDGYHWVAYEIVSNLTVKPVFTQFKLHSDAMQINEDGWPRLFGRSRLIQLNSVNVESLTAFEGAMLAGTTYFDQNIAVKTTDTVFNSAGDKTGTERSIPFTIDTSCPFIVRFSGRPIDTGTHTFDVRITKIGPGATVTAAEPGSPSAFLQTVSVTQAMTNDILAEVEAEFDVSDYVSRRAGGSGDKVGMSIESTSANDFHMTELSFGGTTWCLGGHGD